MHLPAMGDQDHSADPEQQETKFDPQPIRVAVESANNVSIDVQRKYEHRNITAGRCHRLEYRKIIKSISPASWIACPSFQVIGEFHPCV